MVMHARKQPRLNDGYADRKDAHLHKDMQYNSSLFADDSDDDGPLSSRISPRNQNKSSYTERNKEKRGSLSLAEKKVSHYLATGSLGRPIPMETSFAFSGEPSSGVPDTSRPTASAGQRAGAQSDRGIKEYNNYQGSKTEYKGSTPSSSSQHQEHRISTKQYPGGEFNSHTEKALSSVSNNGKQSISSSKEHGKDKEQVQKSAIRVCGDWSEHISSSGKRYYYNCKTEVSQWEKPNEWISQMCKTPDHRSKDGRPKLLSQSNANKISAENRASRHSSSSEHQPLEQARAQRNNSGDNASESQHGRETPLSNTHQHFRDNREFRDSQHLSRENSRDSSGRDIREMHKSSAERTRSGDSTTSNSYHQHNQLVPQKSGSTPGGNNGIPDLQHTDSKRSQHESHFSSSHGDYKRSCNELSRRRRTDSQGSQRYHDTGQGPIDDMEISPSPTPSPSSSYRSSAAGTPQLPPTSTPIATSSTPAHNPVSTPGSAHRSSSPQGNPIPTLVNRQTVNESGTYDKTIQQTLQELQKALSMHIHRAQQNTTNTRSALVQQQIRHTTCVPLSSQQVAPQLNYPAGQGTPLAPGPPMGVHSQLQSFSGLPAHVQSSGVAAGPQGEEMGRTSPVSATSSRSSCGSPTPSDSSSQNAAITSQALSAAALKREETAKLTASLSNYYNEKLIGHVLGWQADLVEKQAAKLWEESMVNGSLQISHISVQLKRARSQVRIAEIQSTLHEQRIMSSDQQRQEIENLKTPSSFLPS